MSAPAIVRQADLTRALKGAQAAGQEVSIDRDGKLRLILIRTEDEPKGWGE